MTVALIAESGIRFMDLPTLLPEIRVAAAQRVMWRFDPPVKPIHTYRRFVKMDDHTYVEKD